MIFKGASCFFRFHSARESDQRRKAVEAAAAMLSGGNNGKFVERTGSLDSHTIGEKLNSPFSEDMEDESPKKKNDILFCRVISIVLSFDYSQRAIKVLNMIKLYGKPIRVNKASQDNESLDVGANLFVGNLDLDVDEKILYDTFSAFGVTVTNPKITRDPEAGNSHEFRFISYDSFEVSNATIESMNGQYLCNRQITMSYAYKIDTKGEHHGTLQMGSQNWKRVEWRKKHLTIWANFLVEDHDVHITQIATYFRLFVHYSILSFFFLLQHCSLKNISNYCNNIQIQSNLHCYSRCFKVQCLNKEKFESTMLLWKEMKVR
ncbi:hypothetical protein L1887_28348 [Cichorium endivia]|nr:hypothetical protein L1887_28348 [Cichorium endivia]